MLADACEGHGFAESLRLVQVGAEGRRGERGEERDDRQDDRGRENPSRAHTVSSTSVAGTRVARDIGLAALGVARAGDVWIVSLARGRPQRGANSGAMVP